LSDLGLKDKEIRYNFTYYLLGLSNEAKNPTPTYENNEFIWYIFKFFKVLNDTNDNNGIAILFYLKNYYKNCFMLNWM